MTNLPPERIAELRMQVETRPRYEHEDHPVQVDELLSLLDELALVKALVARLQGACRYAMERKGQFAAVRERCKAALAEPPTQEAQG